MWIVALALRRPYTFIVMTLVLLILSPIVIFRTPTDIFPDINIPVISIVWNYSGLSPEEMSSRITTITERALTTLVNDIDHIGSQSLSGQAVVKVFFRPRANIQTALAQVTAISQTQLRLLPAGTTPPLIIQYSASSVPILQLGLSSDTLPEQQLFDLAVNFIRTQLITVQGTAIPFPTVANSGRSKLISIRKCCSPSNSPRRCGERFRGAESHPAGGHGEDRLARIPGGTQCQPADRG
jgi:multidrug efflux pump subunit AcrB